MNEFELGVQLHTGLDISAISDLYTLLDLVLSAAEPQAASTISHRKYLWVTMHHCLALIGNQDNPTTRQSSSLLRDPREEAHRVHRTRCSLLAVLFIRGPGHRTEEIQLHPVPAATPGQVGIR